MPLRRKPPCPGSRSSADCSCVHLLRRLLAQHDCRAVVRCFDRVRPLECDRARSRLAIGVGHRHIDCAREGGWAAAAPEQRSRRYHGATCLLPLRAEGAHDAELLEDARRLGVAGTVEAALDARLSGRARTSRPGRPRGRRRAPSPSNAPSRPASRRQRPRRGSTSTVSNTDVMPATVIVMAAEQSASARIGGSPLNGRGRAHRHRTRYTGEPAGHRYGGRFLAHFFARYLPSWRMAGRTPCA